MRFLTGLFVLLVGCSQAPEQFPITLVKADSSITFPEVKYLSHHWPIYSFDSVLGLNLLLYYEGGFDFYTAESRSRIEVEALDRSSKVVDYLFVNSDSILVLVSPKTFLFIDTLGRTLGKPYVFKGKMFGRQNFDFSTPYLSGLLLQRDRVFVSINPKVHIPTYEQWYFSLPYTATFSLKKERADLLYTQGRFPSFTSVNSYGKVGMATCLAPDGTLLIGHPATDSVHAYKDGTLVGRGTVRSRYHRPAIPYPKEMLLDYSYKFKYWAVAGGYEHILYDKYRNQFYRIYLHPYHRQSADGTMRSLGDGDWSIIIFDRDLDIKGEVVLKGTEYGPAIIPASEGIYILRNPHRSNQTSDKQFDLFTLAEASNNYFDTMPNGFTEPLEILPTPPPTEIFTRYLDKVHGVELPTTGKHLYLTITGSGCSGCVPVAEASALAFLQKPNRHVIISTNGLREVPTGKFGIGSSIHYDPDQKLDRLDMEVRGVALVTVQNGQVSDVEGLNPMNLEERLGELSR